MTVEEPYKFRVEFSIFVYQCFHLVHSTTWIR